MHTTEITPIDVIEVLTSTGIVAQDDADVDKIYCDIMRDTATHDYAQQMKKPADFLTKQYAKSKCLIAAWKAIATMKDSSLHEIMTHVIGLAALYVHCTENMDETTLQAYNNELPVDSLLQWNCHWKSVRRACIHMDTSAKGIHSFHAIQVIKYCLVTLVNYITNTPEMVPAFYVSEQFAVDDIYDMFAEYAKQ